MEYISLGNSGLKVSKLCLGTWHLPPSKERDQFGVLKVDEELTKKIVQRAVDLGINFFDTANIYHGTMQGVDPAHAGNSERILGESLEGYDRESLVIATKVLGRVAEHANGAGLSRKHVNWQIKESLKRLKTSYIDVYQMHRPDPSTPIEETLETFSDLVRQGLVNYVGESYFDPVDIADMVQISASMHLPFISMQEPYNLIERGIETEKFWLAKKYGLGIMAYIPLAQGVLTGKYENGIPPMSRAEYVSEIGRRYLTPQTLEAVKELGEMAREKGVSSSQLSLAWILKQSEINGITIVPIIGATKVEHLEDNVGALDVKLSSDDMKRLDEISKKAVVNWKDEFTKVRHRSYG
ncbi:MAG: aldo/keto reductase [Thermoprotei archaeon]